jgi:hypothetical protein
MTFLGGMTAGAAELATEVFIASTQIAADLAAASIAEAAGAFESVLIDIANAIRTYNTVVTAAGAAGTLTRIIACGDLGLLAGTILEHNGYLRMAHVAEWTSPMGCGFLLELVLAH